MEKKIEQLYENIQLPHEIREDMEEELQTVIKQEKEKFEIEIDGLLGQKRALEHKREKLMEAHYSDAISLPEVSMIFQLPFLQTTPRSFTKSRALSHSAGTTSSPEASMNPYLSSFSTEAMPQENEFASSHWGSTR